MRTLRGHQVGAEHLDLAGDGLRIGGQRADYKGRRSVHDQRGFAFLLLVENVAQFQLGALQPTRFDIGRVHRARQIEHHHLRRLLAEYRLRQFLPGRPGQRENRQHAAHTQRHHRPRPLPRRLADQQMRQQLRIHHTLPALAGEAALPHPPKQQ